MEVTMDAIDWEQLMSFGDADAFMEWYYEDDEDEGKFRCVSCYDQTDWSDSGIRYFGVANVLEHLKSVADPELAEHLSKGICRLIAENGHVDEFKFNMSEASEGCYMLSMSPNLVREVKEHIDVLDRARCIALLKEHPASDEDYIMNDLDEMFVSIIDQYAKMVDVAVSKNYGLLIHCG